MPFCEAFAPGGDCLSNAHAVFIFGCNFRKYTGSVQKIRSRKVSPGPACLFWDRGCHRTGNVLPETGLDFAAAGGFGFFLLFLAGLLVSVALVLPGISASYMLLLLGLYEITLSAIDRMELLFLSPLILGVLVGILLTTRLLETAMQRFPTASYLMIAGFAAGSVTEVFPGFPSEIHIFICAVTLLAGFFSTLLLSRLIRRTGTSLHTAYTGRN